MTKRGYRTRHRHQARRSRIRSRLASYLWATSRAPLWRRNFPKTSVPTRPAREIAITARREESERRRGRDVL